MLNRQIVEKVVVHACKKCDYTSAVIVYLQKKNSF